MGLLGSCRLDITKSAPRSGMFSVVVHALLMLWGSVDVVVALAVLVMVPVPVT